MRSMELIGFRSYLVIKAVSPLGGGGTLTSNVVPCSGFNTVKVYAYSDQASAVNGLAIEQSIDGVNFDVVNNFSLLAATALGVAVTPIVGQYLRASFTNGVAAQLTFRYLVTMQP